MGDDVTVWIVLRNGKVDAVFDNEQAAVNHRANLTRLWSLTDIIELQVQSI